MFRSVILYTLAIFLSLCTSETVLSSPKMIIRSNGDIGGIVTQGGIGGEFTESSDTIFKQLRERRVKSSGGKIFDTPCKVKGVKMKCFVDAGDFVVERAIPVMPGNLFRKIAGEAVSATGYDRDVFWKRIRNFSFTGNGSLLNPIDHGWAYQEKIAWIDADKDPDAAEVLRIWNEIVEWAANQRPDRNGLNIVVVSHDSGRIRKSTQLCWMYFMKADPEAPHCTAVVIESEGKTYVRFIYGFFEGGYSLEPPNSFSCQIGIPAGENVFSTIARKWKSVFEGRPYSFQTVAVPTNKGVGPFRLKKESSISEIFPNYRETVGMSIFINADESSGGVVSYYLEVTYTMLISRQNIADYEQFVPLSREQLVFYNNKIRDAVQSDGSCNLQP